jgi:hypothetical protein
VRGSFVTSSILFVCKNVGFQKLDLNLIAYEIIKGVFFFPFPKVLGLYLFHPINIRAYKC